MSELDDDRETPVEGLKRRLCPHHPNVDYRTAWGCPECVEELRVKLAETRGLLAEAFPLVKGWFCDTPNPGNGDLIARIEEALHGPRPTT